MKDFGRSIATLGLVAAWVFFVWVTKDMCGGILLFVLVSLCIAVLWADCWD